MSRINRALTVLALSAALAIGTTTVAVAAQPTQDLNEQRKALYQAELEQNLAAGTADRTQAAVEQARAGEREFAATAAQPVAEDQNDRLLRAVEAAAAGRTQAAVEQARAGERSLDPAPVVTIAPQPVPAATGRGVDPLAVLVLGLIGGLAGGAAAMAGWTAANRRHARRVVAA